MKILPRFLKAVLFLAALAMVPCAMPQVSNPQPSQSQASEAQLSKPPCKAFTGFAPIAQTEAENVLRVELGLKKGRLVAARVDLSLSKQFLHTPHRISQAEAERLLVEDLNTAFAAMPQFYWFGLKNTAQKSDQEGKLNDAATHRLRNFTGAWEQFCDAFMPWVEAMKPPGIQLGPALRTYFSGIPADLGAIFQEDSPLALSAKDGVITLGVANPISGWADPTDPTTQKNQFKVTIEPPVSDQHVGEVVSVLRPMIGRLWRRKEIVNLLEDYYLPQGLTEPAIDLTAARNPPPWTVTVTESVRVAQILVCPAGLKNPSAEMVLYELLTTEDFRAFRACGSHLAPAAIPNCKAFDYAALDNSPNGSCRGQRSSTGGPLLNRIVLQAQAAELAKLGFAVTVPVAVGKDMADLVAQQGKSGNSAASGSPASGATASAKVPPVPQTAANPGTLAAPTGPLAGGPVPVPSPNAAASETKPPPERVQNFLGGGVDYVPGQGVRPFALYNRAGLLGDDSLTAQAGANGKALGSLSYSSDYAWFNQFHRRLTLQLTGASDFQEKRFLLGSATDERGTGALARANLEFFRDLRGTQLQVFLEARQTRVTLNPAGRNQRTTNLSTLDAGADFVLDHTAGPFGRRLELDPDLRFGIGLTAAEPTYQTGSLAASFQQNLPHLFQLHFFGRAKTASGGTPIFELPSFGGQDTVRGFRMDDGLGRRLLSLQSEVWSPLPYFTNNSGKIGQFLHQNVWLAGFFDAGGSFQTMDRFKGVREGSGLGARLNYRLVTFKADWGYGIGQGRTGEGHGRFYFSVTNWLPL